MKKQSSRAVVHSRKTGTKSNIDMDGPFAALAVLKQRMAAKQPDGMQVTGGEKVHNITPKFVTKPTGKALRSPAKKTKHKAPSNKLPSVTRLDSDQSKSLDPSKFENGRKLIHRTQDRGGWKKHADEIEAWLESTSALVRNSGQDYPEAVPIQTLKVIEQRIKVGTIEAFRDDSETEVVLGIDFGTTSTKIVASFPYKAGKPTYAVPALEGLWEEGHPHLFPSALWIDSSSRFHIAPKPGRRVLPELKRDLLEERETCTGSDPAVPIDPRVAVAAFLALHIRHTRGWVLGESQACRSGEVCAWTVHVGFPAAALDGRIAEPFEHALAAALILARTPSVVSCRSVTNVLKRISDPSSTLENEMGAVFPEISASVAGFAASQRLESGLYCLVDIGGTTLDCCTFDLRASEDGIRNPIFVACVAPFGIQNLDLWRSRKKRVETFVEAIKWPIRHVIHSTKARRQPNSPRWSSTLPIFTTGGGATVRAYRMALGETGAWLRKHLSSTGNANIVKLPIPESFQGLLCDEQDVHRLNVAFGLSREKSLIPASTLPAEIEDVPLPHRKSVTFIGPEHV